MAWNVITGTSQLLSIPPLPSSALYSSHAHSNNGSFIAYKAVNSANKYTDVVIMDATTNTEVKRIQTNVVIETITFSNDDQKIIVGGPLCATTSCFINRFRVINLINIETGSIERTLDADNGINSLSEVNLTKDGSYLIAMGSGVDPEGILCGFLRVWKTTDYSVVYNEDQVSYVSCYGFDDLSVHPNSTSFALSGEVVRLYKLEPIISNTAPTTPILNSPVNGIEVTAPPVFTFQSTDSNSDALTYKIELSLDDFATIAESYDQSLSTLGWSQSSYQSGELAQFDLAQVNSSLAQGAYGWRVSAFDGVERGAFSEIRTFTSISTTTTRWRMFEPIGVVADIPSFKFELISPEQSPTTAFYVDISRNSDFSQSITFDNKNYDELWYVFDTEAGILHSFTPFKVTDYDLGYYWRVRLIDTATNETLSVSPTQSFKVIRSATEMFTSWSMAGRKQTQKIVITNPYDKSADYALNYIFESQDPNFTGSFSIRMLDGTVLGTANYGELLSVITPPLPPGKTTLYLDTFTTSSTPQSMGVLEPQIIPVLVWAGWTIGSYAANEFLIKPLCNKIAGGPGWQGKLTNNPADFPTVGDIAGEASEELRDNAIKQLTNQTKEELYWVSRNVAAGIVAEQPLVSFAKAAGRAANWAGAGLSCYEGAMAAYEAIANQQLPEIPGPGENIPGVSITKQNNMSIVGSFDPNIKIGIPNEVNYIRAVSAMPYTILFENKAEATLGAQKVVITDVLDSDLDLTTFNFLGIEMLGKQYGVPAGSSFSTSIPLDVPGEPNNPLNPPRSINVAVDGSLNTSTRQITITYRALDPVTGELNPYGFLNPNKVSPEGEGGVSYVVSPSSGLPSGTEIRNKATIIFDTNAPLDTNEVIRILDMIPPVTNVGTLPSVSYNPDLVIPITATDAGSGVANVELWYSYNGGQPKPITSTDATENYQITLSNLADGVYQFYTVGKDNVGNRADFPGSPQTTVEVKGSLRPNLAVNINGSIVNKAVFAKQKNVGLLPLQLIGDSDEAVTIKRLKLAAQGTGDDSRDVIAVKVFEDSNANGYVDTGERELARGSYAVDNGFIDVLLTYTVPQGATRALVVSYDFR